MKIIHFNLKQGEIKIRMENPDDLWYLSQVVDPKDIVQGKTLRKIKTGTGISDENSSSEKRLIFLSIIVEKVEFHKYTNQLRISGTVSEGTDDVPKGSYHTFDIEEGTIITIIKERWPKFQLDRLNEAADEKAPTILICIFDREEVIFALMKKYGYEILSGFLGNVEKKVNGTVQKGGDDFYSQIITSLEEYNKRYNLDNIIIASPSFWKDNFMKFLKNHELKKKIFTATCSSVTKNAIDEVLKRDEIKQVMKKDRATKEAVLVEQLFLEISKSANAAYGLLEVLEVAEAGAIERLLLTDIFIQKTRANNNYYRIEKVMKQVESMRGDVTIISGENDAGKKLDGLGGIGAILRYKLNYS